jgi:hypothetical protein
VKRRESGFLWKRIKNLFAVQELWTSLVGPSNLVIREIIMRIMATTVVIARILV